MSGQAIDIDSFAQGLRSAWSHDTSSLWSQENPARGQCGVTSLVAHDVFGGKILKTVLPEGPHYYNKIGGHRFDFTSAQFEQPIDYQDLPSDREEAMSATNSRQYHSLREALGLSVKD